MFFKKELTFLSPEVGRKSVWWYLLSIIIVTVFWQVIGAIPLIIFLVIQIINQATDTSSLEQISVEESLNQLFQSQPFITNILFNLAFVSGLFGLFISIKYIHNQKFLSLVTAKKKLNYAKIGIMFLFWLVVSFVMIGYDYIRGGAEIKLNSAIYAQSYLYLFIPLSLLLTLIQTGFEEVLFRGYLAQFLYQKFKLSKIIILFITTFVFGILHFSNPENALGWPLTVSYFLIGGLLGIISYLDDGLESAIAIHWANNWFGTIIFGIAGGVLPLTAFFAVENYTFGWLDLIVNTVIFGLVVLIFSYLKNKYSRLFE